MTTDNDTSAITEDTGSAEQTNNQAVKTYTQKEVDDMMAKTKTAITKKLSTRYEDLGDPDELRNIVTNYKKQQQDLELKRGNFDSVLTDIVSKKDAEISKRDRIIESYKVETPIIEAASRYRAVNSEQVKSLVRNNVRLNADGEVEVLDEKGTVRYDDNGRPVTVDSYVQTWLQQNPHFVQPTPSTTGTRSSIGVSQDSKLDINKLDMRREDHRKLYAEIRKSQ